jgi:hypothetical protein
LAPTTVATDVPTPRDLATQLIAHARRNGRASGAVEVAATAFDGLAAQLCRWLGAGGCHALLTRALAQAKANHPALSGLEIVSGANARVGRVSEGVEAHGAKKMGAGLEAALVSVLDLVGRLIGDDLSVKLVELSMANGGHDAATPEDERAP